MMFRGIDLTELVLTSPRLTLRPWQATDAGAVAQVMATGEMHRYLDLPEPYTPADALDFVARVGRLERERGTGVDCALVESGTGEFVGAASLRLPLDMRAPDIGYWIAPAAQGQGYATEATTALADWAFAHGEHRVELRTDVTNIASARVALRAGFGFESDRRDGLAIPGGRRDLAIFVRTADDPVGPIAATFPAIAETGLTDDVIALRPLAPDDLAGYTQVEHDPVTVGVGFTGETPPPRDVERRLARSRLDLLVGTRISLAIIDVATAEFAGSIGLWRGGPPQIGGIGYAVHPAFRGRGYTTRALRLLTRWAFEEADFARLELGAKVFNLASQRSALSAGFTAEGVQRGRLRNPDGTFSDEAQFGLVNPRYS